MNNFRFELNTSGVAKLLHCSEMQGACNDIANKIADDPSNVHGSQGSSRYHVLVHSENPDETLGRFYGEAEN